MLAPSDFLGRRVDILGVRQQISANSAANGTAYPIFTTGNIIFPAQGQRKVYVLYIVWDGITGTEANRTFSMGSSTSGYTDFAGATSLAQSPALNVNQLIIPNQNTLVSSLVPVLYAPGQIFGVISASGSASTDLMTATAYGWAY
jgi:hypothetical protein